MNPPNTILQGTGFAYTVVTYGEKRLLAGEVIIAVGSMNSVKIKEIFLDLS
jgi:hypothetical protein